MTTWRKQQMSPPRRPGCHTSIIVARNLPDAAAKKGLSSMPTWASPSRWRGSRRSLRTIPENAWRCSKMEVLESEKIQWESRAHLYRIIQLFSHTVCPLFKNISFAIIDYSTFLCYAWVKVFEDWRSIRLCSLKSNTFHFFVYDASTAGCQNNQWWDWLFTHMIIFAITCTVKASHQRCFSLLFVFTICTGTVAQGTRLRDHYWIFCFWLCFQVLEHQDFSCIFLVWYFRWKKFFVSLCTSQGKHQTYGKFFTLLIHSLKIADHFALGYYHSTGERLFSSFPSFR